MNKKDFVRVNEYIRFSPVMVIHNDNNLGVMPTKKALDMARSFGLDLVEVAPHARPPVCRIIDFGKFKYDKNKKEKQKKNKEAQLKEIRLRPCTDDHDIETKISAIKKFLISGHKVQVKVRFKKREKAHKELGILMINKIIEQVVDVGQPQGKPLLNEESVICILHPNQ